ncbi:MAG: hypothetical protein ACI8RD_002012, partial [Bacillariaceae sp.]
IQSLTHKLTKVKMERERETIQFNKIRHNII